MKISIVIGPYNPIPLKLGGAVERVHFMLAREFVASGHQVTMISRQFEGYPEEEVLDGVQHRRVASQDAPRGRFAYRYYDLLYSLRVARMLPPSDVTVTNSVFLPLVLPKQRAGHIYVHAARFPKGQMGLNSRASRIQTVSEIVAEAIRKQSPRVANRVISIPNPLAPVFLSPGEQTSQDREKVILFVGRLAREKGAHVLIKAFRELDAAVRGSYRLVVVGPHEIRQQGDGEEYLAELKAAARGIDDRVSFPGPVFDTDQLSKIYRSADIFVYPSLADAGETFGIAPLEAMASGCRVVISALPCFREFAKPGEDCTVFDHRSDPVSNLKAALTNVIASDPDRFRTAAVKTASTFTTQAIAARYLSDFSKLVGQR